MSLKDKIKEAQDITSEVVEVPEWGVSVQVRTMSGSQRAKMLDTCLDKDGNFVKERMFPFMVIACAFDPETGQRIFAPEDATWLSEKSAGALERLVSVAMRVSGLTKEATVAAEKNS